MWLSGMNQPDHRTINRFRGKVMKAVIEEVFYSVLEQLLDKGYIDLEKYFVDGTKLEANANRYSYVWRKNTERYKAQLQERIRGLLDEIDEIEAEEEAEYGDQDLEEVGEGKEINSEELKKVAERINQKLNKDPKNKKLKQAKRSLEKEIIPRQEKYEEQAKKLNGRNSYSKTDEDATFMRMKEDHLGKGQPKPDYNIQMGTQNQYVIGYSIHQHPGDTLCLKPHLKHIAQWLGEYPETVIADAGYGSEENYAYLRENNVVPYVKYNTFHLEQKRNFTEKKKYRPENFTYLPEEDQYICPQGERLSYLHTQAYVTQNGYKSERRVYGNAPCQACPVLSDCAPYSKKKCRRLTVSVELLKLRKEARDHLLSPRGKRMRSQRPIEVEAVFGRLKHNWGFRRFMLRGLENVKTEWGILCLAHNIAKAATQ
jgi:hypothetical protein